MIILGGSKGLADSSHFKFASFVTAMPPIICFELNFHWESYSVTRLANRISWVELERAQNIRASSLIG